MLTLSAPVELHVKVALFSSVIVEKSEVILTEGRSPTCTVTVPVADPDVFVAVIV